MAKRDMNEINTRSSAFVIPDLIETGNAKRGQQGTAGIEEQKRRQREMKTQGRKGCKSMRFNMAWTPDNYEFIRLVSSATGSTMTGVVNKIVEKYRLEHEDALEAVEKSKKALEKLEL
jgi:hypothetical protein